MAGFAVVPSYVEEAHAFQEGLKSLFEALEGGLERDEELALFHVNGAQVIRIHHIRIASDAVLLMSGEDQEGIRAGVITSPKAFNLIYKKLKLSAGTKRTPIGFSIEQTDISDAPE